MEGLNRDLIELAISNLEKQGGVQHLADAIRELLGECIMLSILKNRCALTDENLDMLVKVSYPPNPNWTPEVTERHFHHIRMALAASPEEWNKDIGVLLRKNKG
jgi:hypothetical protein